jgi:hypothetical protein
MIRCLWVLALQGCGLWISTDEVDGRLDADGDGFLAPAFGGEDCLEGDASVYPGAPDVPYDGVDADCRGDDDFDQDRDGLRAAEHGGADCDDLDPAVGDRLVFWYPDCDGDGFATDVSVQSCRPPEEAPVCGGAPANWLVAPTAFDCDDTDADVAPDAVEVWYNGVDDDCSGPARDDYDADGDGFPALGRPGAVVPDGMGDCDDADPTVHPDADEQWYDGVDQDCDGRNDFDRDGDGYVVSTAPEQTGGTALLAGDCQDLDPAVHPGAEEVWYDGVDQNCDQRFDFDRDQDGAPAAAYAAPGQAGDCDDLDPFVGPTLPEIWYDGVDQDCDGADDFDQDGDGQRPGDGDCDDTDPTVNTAAIEVWYDGVDQDCLGDDDFDRDGDGASVLFGDCDDGDPTIRPGAVDVPYDGVDSDCDGRNDDDADGDGFVRSGDCNDLDPDVYPGAIEIPYDGIDQDCDPTTLDRDNDGDGVTIELDCDDTDPDVFPGNDDPPYDGIDTNCDPTDDRDADGDGAPAPLDPNNPEPGDDCNDFVATIGPSQPEVHYDGIDQACNGDADEYDADGDGRPIPDDCDDTNPAVFPENPPGSGFTDSPVEVHYDDVDDNCDGGADDYDADGDGWVEFRFAPFVDPAVVGLGDCDDTDPTRNPGVDEVWYDGLDQDCDGRNDYDADGDGHVPGVHAAFAGGTATAVGDCDDADAERHYGQLELPVPGADPVVYFDCGEERDDDLDGVANPDDCDDDDPSRWSLFERVAAGDLTGGTDPADVASDVLDERLGRLCDGGVLELAALNLPLRRAFDLDREVTVRADGAVIVFPADPMAEPLVRVLPGADVDLVGLTLFNQQVAAPVPARGVLQVAGVARLWDTNLLNCSSDREGACLRVAPTGVVTVDHPDRGQIGPAFGTSGTGVFVETGGWASLRNIVYVHGDASASEAGPAGAFVLSDGGTVQIENAFLGGGEVPRAGAVIAAHGGELSIEHSQMRRWRGASLIEVIDAELRIHDLDLRDCSATDAVVDLELGAGHLATVDTLVVGAVDPDPFIDGDQHAAGAGVALRADLTGGRLVLGDVTLDESDRSTAFEATLGVPDALGQSRLIVDDLLAVAEDQAVDLTLDSLDAVVELRNVTAVTTGTTPDRPALSVGTGGNRLSGTVLVDIVDTVVVDSSPDLGLYTGIDAEDSLGVYPFAYVHSFGGATWRTETWDGAGASTVTDSPSPPVDCGGCSASPGALSAPWIATGLAADPDGAGVDPGYLP